MDISIGGTPWSCLHLWNCLSMQYFVYMFEDVYIYYPVWRGIHLWNCFIAWGCLEWPHTLPSTLYSIPTHWMYEMFSRFRHSHFWILNNGNVFVQKKLRPNHSFTGIIIVMSRNCINPDFDAWKQNLSWKMNTNYLNRQHYSISVSYM